MALAGIAHRPNRPEHISMCIGKLLYSLEKNKTLDPPHVIETRCLAPHRDRGTFKFLYIYFLKSSFTLWNIHRRINVYTFRCKETLRIHIQMCLRGYGCLHQVMQRN